MDLPADVVEWAREVFRLGNERTATKLSNNPNIPEPSLDLTWIEHLSQYSSPVTLGSDWTVQIETHFLGGLRHWYGWEIADIGLLAFVQTARDETRNKVALLQSKRLYPLGTGVEEETRSDFEVGFGRLADPEVLARPINLDHDFEFSDECVYGALKAGSKQTAAIDEYEENVGLKVYYQFYNPWTVPFEQRIPLRGVVAPPDALSHGVRVFPARGVHELLRTKPDRFSPSLSDLEGVPEANWKLEDFVADEWLGCREGDSFESAGDQPIRSLFFRRTGAISAAISIRVQAPGVGGR